ncbi:Monooxygenase FAD-binding [Penicillium cf. griseofulvum]|uniref:Monooxygenase FAD-binding n=1 Tax=Penicillium cf. griseofulvum TaxID=2972120 RepID=A0A9W9J602_9EURO|nr:Monooxygenase FAD-binding [Penicillium cf. griseofulvum]KAJ5433995.1 Monooxygenase FAD-binding [Penicillium cf. griseofulvum]KAJ5451824.1 Monooxygenase FAD-binding [Penicillium cf. griseofulvum]
MDKEDKYPQSKTDVLIIGAGPSGLMAAYWMARYGVNARIIDKRNTKVFLGHADGLRARTLELFDSMGFQHRVMQEGSISTEANIWAPGPMGKLIRQDYINVSRVEESPFYNTCLTQGRIERFILDSIREHSGLDVEYSVIAKSLEYEEESSTDVDSYPITVKVRVLGEDDSKVETGCEAADNEVNRNDLLPDEWADLAPRKKPQKTQVETIKAKYLIGCDGAHSWTRKQLKIPVEGSNTDHIWGVIDVVPLSDFPDVRRLSIVANAAGTILVVPRERGLVRFYVPVQSCEAGATDRFDRSKIPPSLIRERVQAIFAPFTFDYKECSWWTVYQVGQRISAQCTNDNRIFLAGDAVHTHSPKMGLGMNMSLQDGFNVGWKIALAVAGSLNPEILETYAAERHPLAEMLLDFDRNWSPIFNNQKPEVADTKASDMALIAERFEDFADGWKVFYPASSLVRKAGNNAEFAFARHMIPGERVRPVKLRNQADGAPLWTTRSLESDGRFRVLVLAGDIRNPIQKQRIETLSRTLAGHSGSNSSPLGRYLGIPGRFESPVDVFTVHASPWKGVEFFDFPEILRPFDSVKGWAYEKIWCDDACLFDRYCDGTAYKKWGVDRVLGALVVIRPDQYIGWVGELGDVEEMTQYLDGILVKKSPTDKIDPVR